MSGIRRLPGIGENDHEVVIFTMAGNEYIVHVSNIYWNADHTPSGFLADMLLRGTMIPWHNVTAYRPVRGGVVK